MASLATAMAASVLPITAVMSPIASKQDFWYGPESRTYLSVRELMCTCLIHVITHPPKHTV